METKLSILICSLPDRFLNLYHLTRKLDEQIHSGVEYLYLGDNKTMSTGEKREWLKKMAKGNYISFIDDDDDISVDYVPEILKAMESNPDVICFQCKYESREKKGYIFFGMDFLNKDEGSICYRMPYHICAIKREIAMQVEFPSVNIAEDTEFATQLFDRCLINSEVKIDKVLYHYKHSENSTSVIKNTKKENKVDVIIVSDGNSINTSKTVASLNGEVMSYIVGNDEGNYPFSETIKINYNKELFINSFTGKAPILVFASNHIVFPAHFIHSVTKLIQGYDKLTFPNQSGNDSSCTAITRDAWKSGKEPKILKTKIRVMEELKEG